MKFFHELTIQHPELLGQGILETAIQIENAPYTPLTVEYIGQGPRGLPALSVAHYGEQNGDLMRDPEMCFEMEIENGIVKEFHPYYFRNDYVGMEQYSVIYHGNDSDNKPVYTINTIMMQGQREFAETWSQNLERQGFLKPR